MLVLRLARDGLHVLSGGVPVVGSNGELRGLCLSLRSISLSFASDGGVFGARRLGQLSALGNSPAEICDESRQADAELQQPCALESHRRCPADERHRLSNFYR